MSDFGGWHVCACVFLRQALLLFAAQRGLREEEKVCGMQRLCVFAWLYDLRIPQLHGLDRPGRATSSTYVVVGIECIFWGHLSFRSFYLQLDALLSNPKFQSDPVVHLYVVAVDMMSILQGSRSGSHRGIKCARAVFGQVHKCC